MYDMIDLDMLVWDEFPEDTPIRKIGSIGSMHDEFPRSSFSEFECLKRIGESVWSPPFGENCWICIRLPELCWSRVESVGRENVEGIDWHGEEYIDLKFEIFYGLFFGHLTHIHPEGFPYMTI